MFDIEMLPAGHGDALFVEYGTEAERHRIRIDAGTFHSWAGVRARLAQLCDTALDLFVVTHIDEDHIGGAVALLDDPDLSGTISDVWFNGYVHCAQWASLLGPVL